MKISAKYKSIWTNLIVTIVVLLAIFFLVPKLLAFFWPFVVGLIISVIAAPAVRFLESKVKIRRKIGSAVMIVAVIALIGFLLYGLGVLLFTLAQRLSDILPNLLSGIESDTADAASALAASELAASALAAALAAALELAAELPQAARPKHATSAAATAAALKSAFKFFFCSIYFPFS